MSSGKIFYFDRKFKKGGQKSQKRAVRFLKNFFKIFCKFQPAKFQIPPLGKQWLLAPSPTPPLPSPSPLSVSKICLKGWVFWHGMGLSRCGHQRQPKAECTEGPYIFSWLVTISNSVNEFFVAV